MRSYARDARENKNQAGDNDKDRGKGHKPFKPSLEGNICKCKRSQTGGGPDHVAEAVAKLECQNSTLAANADQVRQRGNNRHSGYGLRGTGRNQKVKEELDEVDHQQSKTYKEQYYGQQYIVQAVPFFSLLFL